MKGTAVKRINKVVREGSHRRAAKELLTEFSVVEDSPKVMSVLKAIGARTGRKAVAAAKAAGVTTAYMKNNKIVKEDAQGNTTAINPVFKRSSYYLTIKPGTKFNAATK
jgi:hypothetical protein